MFFILSQHTLAGERLFFNETGTNFSYFWSTEVRGFGNWIYGLRGDFDIRYNITGYRDSTTYANNGYWVRWAVDDGPEQLLLGTNEGKGSYNKINVSTRLTQPIGPNYVLIEFVAHNTDSEPHKFKISSWTDIQLAGDDYASVYPIETNGVIRGLRMASDTASNKTKKPSNLKLVLIVRDGYGVRNVDTFYYGEWYLDPNGGRYNMHYWENRSVYDDLIGIDSVFSYGWDNTNIYPNEEISFGVLLGYSEVFKYPSVIKLNNELPTNNLPNATIDVSVTITDENPYTDYLYLQYEFINATNQTETITVGEKFSIGNDPVTKNFQVKLGAPINKHPLRIWAIDENKLSSNIIARDLLVNQIPRLTILNTINDKYYTGGVVEVQGRLWDDTYASITYQFDDDFRYDADAPIQCDGVEQSFRRSFQLKESRMEYGPHTLYIWAKDQFGVKSSIYSINFTYVKLHAPEVELYPFNTAEHHYNDYIEIRGRVRDVDYGDTIRLEYLPEEADPLSSFIEFDTKQSEGDWQDFTLHLMIPPSTTNGTKRIIIRAKDQNGAVSPYAYYNYTFVLIDVTPAPKPDMNETPLPTDLPSDYTGPITVITTSTWTETETTDVNGNPTKTWTYIPTTITISTESGFAQGDAAVVTAISGKKNEKDNNTRLIIGIAAGVAGLVALIAIIIIVAQARKAPAEFNAENVETLGDYADHIEVENDNPIFNQDAIDDPFANEFEDQANDNPAFV